MPVKTVDRGRPVVHLALLLALVAAFLLLTGLLDTALAQQLGQLGPNQRDSSLTIGAEYANKILVKCP